LSSPSAVLELRRDEPKPVVLRAVIETHGKQPSIIRPTLLEELDAVGDRREWVSVAEGCDRPSRRSPGRLCPARRKLPARRLGEMLSNRITRVAIGHATPYLIARSHPMRAHDFVTTRHELLTLWTSDLERLAGRDDAAVVFPEEMAVGDAHLPALELRHPVSS
jgi:hypothetical protein